MMQRTATALPEPFRRRIEKQLGSRAGDFFTALETAAPVSVRINPSKPRPSLLTSSAVPWCSLAYYLDQRPVFTLDPFFHGGTYYVQEAGSMLMGVLVQHVLKGITQPLTVLDLCAAPGGKTTHLLSLLPEGSCLISNEPIPARNAILRENIIRWGNADVIVTQNEAADFSRSGIPFDLIVVDAPCSGEGLFRKDPDAMNEWSEARADGCALRQKQILDDIIPAINEGGYLLYSTCTYNPDENDEQIKRLLADGGFRLALPDPPQGILKTETGWQAWPDLVKAEGFFCTLLQKTASTRNPALVKENRVRSDKELQQVKDKSFSDYLHPESGFSFYRKANFVYALREPCRILYQQSLQVTTIRQAGLLIGEIKGKDLIPSHALAMSINRSEHLNAYTTNHEGALRFLRGQDPGISGEGHGWALLLYMDVVLGWVKKVGGRCNNYYPTASRIRMK